MSPLLLSIACFPCPNDGLHAVLEAKLIQDEGNAIAHGLVADAQPGSDTAIVQAAGEEFENLTLSFGQFADI